MPPKPQSKQKFVEKAIKKHGDKFDFSKTVYCGARVDTLITCPYHGDFKTKPHSFLRSKWGCRKCFQEFQNKSNSKKFAKTCSELHKGKYDYSKVRYEGKLIPVEIVCPKHGSFFQRPAHHVDGKGCQKCGSEATRLDQKIWEERSSKIHGNFYDYSLVEYITATDKVKIVCPKHGIFEQVAHYHCTGSGCPVCKESSGEKHIRVFLENEKIVFESQKIFANCRDKSYLPFDFYLPDYNLLIEYQGRQHYEAVDFFGGEKGLEDRIKKDEIKRRYSERNKISLLYLTYKMSITERNKYLTFLLGNRNVSKKCLRMLY